jgi:glycosyltransferase involved in cell wall biosynthesis
LFQAYADADVLALPSLSEGTPRVLVEARAFGCAVVATTVGGIPTSVTHGVDGLLVPPGDPAALCEALVQLAADEQERQRLVDGGLRRARQCTIEVMVNELAAQLELAGAR